VLEEYFNTVLCGNHMLTSHRKDLLGGTIQNHEESDPRLAYTRAVGPWVDPLRTPEVTIFLECDRLSASDFPGMIALDSSHQRFRRGESTQGVSRLLFLGGPVMLK